MRPNLFRKLLLAISIALILASAWSFSEADENVQLNKGQKASYTIFSLFDRVELGDDYPYDLATIKNMTLTQLNWTNVDVDGDGSATTNIPFEGKTILKIEGNFSSGPYTMVPCASLRTGNISNLITVEQWHGAAIYVPEGYPNCNGSGYALFTHIHSVPDTVDPEIEGLICMLVNKFEVPLFLMGNYKQNWEPFDFPGGQDGILYPSILAFLLRNEATADALKMTFMYQLVKENLMGTTLMVRLLENLGGNISKGLLSEGGSKQGYARWLVGMLDDRITMIEADMMQIQDMKRGWAHYVKDWGIPPYPETGPWGVKNYSSQVASVLIPLWESIVSSGDDPTTPGGLAYQIWDIYSQRRFFQHLKFIGILGDVGAKGMHDGTYFPLGAETYFLDDLDFIEWRYGRILPKDLDQGGTRVVLNILEICSQLVNFDLTRWPKVENVTASIEQKNETTNYLNLTASIKYWHPENLVVRAWYASSTNRAWNDNEGLEEPHKWKYAVMTMGTDSYNVTVEINNTLQYAYYIELEYIDELGFQKFDSSRVRFVQEFPPTATGGSDLFITQMSLSDESPEAGQEVLINVTLNATRINIWFAGSYPSPPLYVGIKILVDDEPVNSTRILIVNCSQTQFKWTAKLGMHELKIVADPDNLLPEWNEVNNEASLDVLVVDPIEPEVSNVQALPVVQEVSGWVNITCSVKDNVKVDTVKVNITDPNGNFVGNFTMTGIELDANKNGTYYYNTTYSVLGTYSYYIWANDTSNNQNKSDINTFTTQDTTKPEILNVQAFPSVETQNGWVNITCTVTDNVKINIVKISTTGPAGFTPVNISMIQIPDTNNYYYNSTYPVAGEYSYYIWANDASSNENKSTEYYFTITMAVTKHIEGRAVNVVGVGNGTVNITSAALPQPPPENLRNITCIEVTITGELEYINITIKYSDEDIIGLNEDTLKMYYWHENKWKLCNNTGVDTVNNIVWANVTHLTIFAPMAEKIAEVPPTPLNWLLYFGAIVIIIVALGLAIATRRKRKR
ncbi:MAG: hypothetical protein QME47_05375 [Candidatus Thermoplasmatota archaeon]|nr:hypothetical protein [Candidatus Thermoplasmatota archaeon]